MWRIVQVNIIVVLTCFRKANDPSIADIHNLIGETYLRINEYQRAFEYFNQAL